jgi:hypothetical protein
MFIWALRRIHGWEHFIASGFSANEGIEGTWTFQTCCDGAVPKMAGHFELCGRYLK